MDYTDDVAMAELFFEIFGVDPTGDELAAFMADKQADLADLIDYNDLER